MTMQISIWLATFAAAALSLSSVASASAIKGHARPHELARNSDAKQPRSYSAAAPVAQVPILESTKKIYNDESIRRLAVQQPAVVKAPEAPVAEVVEPEKVAVVQPKSEQAVVVAVQPAVVQQPAVVPVAAVPAASPVEPQAPVVPVVPVAPVVPVVEQPVAPVEAKKAPVVEPPVAVAEQAAAPVKPVVDLPAQTERSAQGQQASPVVVAEAQPAPSAVVVPQEPVVASVVQPVEPVVVVAAAPIVPVAEPAKVESVLQAKKDEPNQVEPFHIEVPAPDPQLVLSEPIDSTTKLLIDLDEHVQKFLPAEDHQQLPAQPPKEQVLVPGVDYSPAAAIAVIPSGKSAPLVPYASADDTLLPIDSDKVAKAGAQPSVAGSPSASISSSSSSSPSTTRQGGQHQQQQQVITQLIDQLDSLQTRIQDTISQLVSRRRYVMSALLRPMQSYVRRVRTNLERLQNRVNQLQAAASSVGGGQNRPGGFVDAAAIETIRRRIEDISKRISDIVNRIRFSLTPTSAPMNSNGRK